MNVEGYAEPVLEPDFFDVQIVADGCQLFAQRYARRIVLEQGVTQKLREGRHHPPRALRVFVNRSAQRVERVEEKVRVELVAKHVQLRLPCERVCLEGTLALITK